MMQFRYGIFPHGLMCLKIFSPARDAVLEGCETFFTGGSRLLEAELGFGIRSPAPVHSTSEVWIQREPHALANRNCFPS